VVRVILIVWLYDVCNIFYFYEPTYIIVAYWWFLVRRPPRRYRTSYVVWNVFQGSSAFCYIQYGNTTAPSHHHLAPRLLVQFRTAIPVVDGWLQADNTHTVTLVPVTGTYVAHWRTSAHNGPRATPARSTQQRSDAAIVVRQPNNQSHTPPFIVDRCYDGSFVKNAHCWVLKGLTIVSCWSDVRISGAKKHGSRGRGGSTVSPYIWLALSENVILCCYDSL